MEDVSLGIHDEKIRVTGTELRVRLKKGHLPFQLGRRPEVVVAEPGKPPAPHLLDPCIQRAGDAAVGFADAAHLLAV